MITRLKIYRCKFILMHNSVCVYFILKKKKVKLEFNYIALTYLEYAKKSNSGKLPGQHRVESTSQKRPWENRATYKIIISKEASTLCCPGKRP